MNMKVQEDPELHVVDSSSNVFSNMYLILSRRIERNMNGFVTLYAVHWTDQEGDH